IWYVRARPSAARRCGASRVTSRPNSEMRPPVGRVSPLIRLNRVVLPAPLGPMIARFSPGPISRLTPSTARSPPNSFERPARLRTTASRVAISAGLGRRIVAVVHGLLQEVVGLVLPELGDVRIGLDDGVPELAVLPLDLADIDVLNRVAVGVELDGPTRRVGDLDLAQRLQKLLAVLDVTADRLRRVGDPPGARVGGLREIRGDLAVLLAVFRDEPLVHRRVEGRAVDERADATDGLVTEGGQDELVEGRAAADQRQLRLQPGVLVLLGAARRRDRHHQGEHRVGVAPDLGEIGREVRGVEGRPELLDDLAAVLLEGLLEATDDLPAERVVHADDGDALVPERLVRLSAARVT